MPEITRRRTGELLQKLFQIFLEAPDGLQARIALKKLAAAVTLSDYEAGVYASGSRRFEKIVRFATVDCVKAGWLVKETGKWSVTELGRTALSAFRDSEDFYKESVRLYHVWKASRDAVEVATQDSDSEENIDKSGLYPVPKTPS